MIALAGSGIVGFLGYLLLAGSMAASELITGTMLGFAVIGWTTLRQRRAPASFAFSAAHVGAWWRALRQLPWQTVVAARFLVQATIRPGAAGGLSAISPFRFGMIDDPVERARRATAVLAASLAPASYIVRITPGRDDVLIHSADTQPDGHPEWVA